MMKWLNGGIGRASTVAVVNVGGIVFVLYERARTHSRVANLFRKSVGLGSRFGTGSPGG